MKKKLFSIFVILILIFLSYFYGLISHKYILPPFPQLLYLKDHLFPERIGFSDTSSKVKVDCDKIKEKNFMVALVLGQSNAGNHGETCYESEEAVFNFNKGVCYKAKDPLLGATGDAGSVWTRLGDMLIRDGLYDRVLFVPIGVGTTSIDQWADGGYLHPRILDAISQLQSKGFEITHIMWHQGPSDKYHDDGIIDKENYKKYFLRILESIRTRGVDAPIYVAVTSYDGNGISKDIQQAQKELVDFKKKIYPGPNTDLLNDKKYRWEVVHFSHLGLKKHADGWLKAIRNTMKK